MLSVRLACERMDLVYLYIGYGGAEVPFCDTRREIGKTILILKKVISSLRDHISTPLSPFREPNGHTCPGPMSCRANIGKSAAPSAWSTYVCTGCQNS